MTGPEDSTGGTRPISVAELLAKNGTIGAPPVGGRRRRRRGNSDHVTVAELTGEIPIITDDTADLDDADYADDATVTAEHPAITGPVVTNGPTANGNSRYAEPVADEVETDYQADYEADYDAHVA